MENEHEIADDFIEDDKKGDGDAGGGAQNDDIGEKEKETNESISGIIKDQLNGDSIDDIISDNDDGDETEEKSKISENNEINGENREMQEDSVAASDGKDIPAIEAKESEETGNNEQSPNAEVILIAGDDTEDVTGDDGNDDEAPKQHQDGEDRELDEIVNSVSQKVISQLAFPTVVSVENEEPKQKANDEAKPNQEEEEGFEEEDIKDIKDSKEKEKTEQQIENAGKQEEAESKTNALSISDSIGPSIEHNESNEPEQENDEGEDDVMLTEVKSKSKIPIIQQPQYSDEELSVVFKKLQTKKILPPLEMRAACIDYGRKLSVQHTILEEYDAAQADDDCVDLLLQSLSDDNRNFASDQEKQSIQSRVAEVTKEQKEIEERYKEIIKSMRDEEQKHLDALLQEQEEERKRFEEKWSNSDSVIPFSKPSPQLLQIKRMQKAMALAHDFGKAKQLKLQADVLQKEEAKVASSKAADTMKTLFISLLEKQQRQVECFKQNYDRKVTFQECTRDAEINSLENTKKQLLSRSTTKPKKPTVTIPQVTNREARAGANTGLITHRTRTQYATFKKSAEQTKLDVKPLDVRSIIRPLTPSPRKAQTQRVKA